MLIIPLIILTLCKTNFRIFQVCFVLCLFKALRAAQYALIGQHAQSAVIWSARPVCCDWSARPVCCDWSARPLCCDWSARPLCCDWLNALRVCRQIHTLEKLLTLQIARRQDFCTSASPTVRRHTVTEVKLERKQTVSHT